MTVGVFVYFVLANGMFLTELKIQGDPGYLHGYQIDKFRAILAERLSIRDENVRFEAAGSGCIILVFQLPETVRADLRKAASEKPRGW